MSDASNKGYGAVAYIKILHFDMTAQIIFYKRAHVNILHRTLILSRLWMQVSFLKNSLQKFQCAIIHGTLDFSFTYDPLSFD